MRRFYLPVLRRRLSSSSSHNFPSYQSPYILSIPQRLFVIPYFGIGSLLDPRRGDLVAGLGDSLIGTTHQLKKLHAKMSASAAGRKLLVEKPLISEQSIDFSKLRSLPRDTLGFAYAEFMDSHAFSPDERSSVRFMVDKELSYVMARYRQVHDFWHVLSGLPTSVLGEVALKWFEWEASGLPSCALGGLLGPLRLAPHERAMLRREYLPWALRAGGACRCLLSFPYEDHFERTLADVREDLRLEPAPVCLPACTRHASSEEASREGV